MSGRLLSVFQVTIKHNKKWRSKLHVAVFFLQKGYAAVQLYTGCSQVFSIDRYKLRDNRVQKQNQKLIFFFFFWKTRHSRTKGSKSTSRCRLMLDNFKFHFRIRLTIISANSSHTQNNNNQFISPQNWKMLLQMLLFFGWPSCVPVCLCAHIRRPSPRSSSVAVVHLAPLSHIPASFLLVHWSFSLHHLALDFQPMCVRFFSCPSLFRRSISIEVVICVSWYGNM